MDRCNGGHAHAIGIAATLFAMVFSCVATPLVAAPDVMRDGRPVTVAVGLRELLP